MPKKEHIRELIKEAIPSSEEGIVNFRALRDVLEASLGHNSTETLKMDSKKNENQSASQTSGNAKKGSSKHNDMTGFAEREFEKTFTKFEDALKNLVQKLDTIENRVSKLEKE